MKSRKLYGLIATLIMALVLIFAFSAVSFAEGGVITTPLDFTKQSVRDAYATAKNGVQLTSETYTYHEGTEWEWTETLYSLTLSDATIDCTSNAEAETAFGIKVPDGTSIILSDGTSNTVKAGPGENGSYGIYSVDEEGNLGSIYIMTSSSAQNKGTLTVQSGAASSCDAGYGIYTSDLSARNIVLNVSGVNSAIYSYGTEYDGDAGFGESVVTAVATSETTASAIVCTGDFDVDCDSTLSACNINSTSATSSAITAKKMYLMNADITGGTKLVTINSVIYVQNGTSSIQISYPDVCSMSGNSYKTIDNAIAAAKTTPSVISLLRDVEISSYIEIEDNQDITIDLNGSYIRASEHKMYTSAFFIRGKAKLTIIDGKQSGGISGFDIKTEESEGPSGAVFRNWGKLVLNGGTITNNKADYAGVVYSGENSVLEINGAILSGNEASKNGGAVYLEDGAKATLIGGVVSNNKAGENGGFAYIEAGAELVMTGGSVTGNSAKQGGGIYTAPYGYNYSGGNKYAVFKMSDGEFTGNTAKVNGGAIYSNGPVYLGGRTKLSGNTLDSQEANNLYLAKDSHVIIGDGTNGVPALESDFKVSVTVPEIDNNYGPVIGAYVITEECSGDFHTYFTSDDASAPAIKDYIVDGDKHVVGIPIADYTLVLQGGKAYKNSVAVENETSVKGLSYNVAEQRWEMKGFDFTTAANPAVNILDNNAKLYIDDSNSNGIMSCSSAAGSIALKANNIEIEADGLFAVWGLNVSVAIDCQTLSFMGDEYLELAALEKAIHVNERPVVKATLPFSIDSLRWDEDNETYLYPDTNDPTPIMYVTKLHQYSDRFGNRNYSYDSFEIGEKYLSGKNYTFDGWYANADYSTARLESEATADKYTEYYAKWINGSYDVVLNGLDLVGDEDAGAYSVRGGKNGISWDVKTKTLTLNNATIDNIDNCESILLPEGSIIVLIGNNIVAQEDYAYDAIEGRNLRICGPGTMKLSTVMNGINSDGTDLIIDGAKINIITDDNGLHAGNGRLYVINDGVVSAISDSDWPVFYAGGGIYAKSVFGGKAYDHDGNDVFESGVTYWIEPISDSVPVVLVGTPTQHYYVGPSTNVKTETKDKDVIKSSFDDVLPEYYCYDAVNWAVGKGITSGKAGNSFAPFGICTRGEFVTFLWRAAGKPVVDYLVPFTDVDENEFYAEAVRWAASEGIIKGKTDTIFDPWGPITRAQAITCLWRYAKAPAFANMTANGPASSPFTDVPTDEYYYSAVLWAKAQGITNGKLDGVFAPYDNCLRGQVVSFLFNFLGK